MSAWARQRLEAIKKYKAATPVEDDGGVVDGPGGSLLDSLVYISCIFSSQNCVHIGGGLKEDWFLPTRGKIHGE